MRTKGFCSALRRCGEIKLIAEKRESPLSAPGANCVPGANTHLRQLLFRRFCRLETFSNPFTIYCLSK